MTVTITVRLSLDGDGTVVIRHECPDAGPDALGRGTVGLPTAGHPPARVAEVARNLRDWVVERFVLEAQAAASNARGD
jgi:hypothetical protein